MSVTIPVLTKIFANLQKEFIAEELADLTQDDIESLKEIILSNIESKRTDQSTLTNIFPYNWEDKSFNQLKSHLETFNNFLVLRDPKSKKIFAVLVYRQLDAPKPYISIQTCLMNNFNKGLSAFLLHQKLEELCKKTICKKISTIPNNEAEKAFYKKMGYIEDESLINLIKQIP